MDRVLDELHRALDAWVPGARAGVIGSTALGLPLEPTDDLDVVVTVPNDARGTDAVAGFPSSLADALTRLGWGRVVAVAAAALAWAVLIYLCIDFGFWNRVIDILPGEDQIWRAGAEVFLDALLASGTTSATGKSRVASSSGEKESG